MPDNDDLIYTFNINHIHKSQKVIAKDNSNEPFGSKMMKLITDEEIMMMPGFVPQLVKDTSSYRALASHADSQLERR